MRWAGKRSAACGKYRRSVDNVTLSSNYCQNLLPLLLSGMCSLHSLVCMDCTACFLYIAQLVSLRFVYICTACTVCLFVHCSACQLAFFVHLHSLLNLPACTLHSLSACIFVHLHSLHGWPALLGRVDVLCVNAS